MAEPEVIDTKTGEIMADMPEERALTPAAQMGIQSYKPTTLLDYSALMMAAQQFKRNPIEALKEATRICTLDEETAKECFYTLPRGGKKISGPSIGLAQTLAACYGNMNITIDDIRILKDEGVVEIRGFILDCQTGLTTSDILRRNIRYGPGHKSRAGELYDEDMISTTVGAAKSLLWRNLVLRIIPRPLVRKVYKAALNVAMGSEKTFGERQGRCIQHWEKTHGVEKAKMLLHLGHTEIADLGIADFEYLLGIENAIKQGDTTVEAIFKKDLVIPAKPGEKPTSLDQVNAELKTRAETEAKEATEAALASAPSFPPEAEPVLESGHGATATEAPETPVQPETPAPSPEAPPETPVETPPPPPPPSETSKEAPPATPEPVSEPKPTTAAPRAVEKAPPGAPIKRPGGPPVKKAPTG